jgi:hypothetical protein
MGSGRNKMLRNPVGATNVLIAINGSPVPGLLHAALGASNCFSADTYALGFAMGPPPLHDITFWSSIAAGYVEIAASQDSGTTSRRLITGKIDTVVIDPIHGTVGIDGRDLSSSLVDSYRQESFVNQTASEVVSVIALNHGLDPVVTPTTDKVGRYYGDGYTHLALGDFSRLRSDWDLVVELARENSFDVFVEGSSLFFQPSSAVTDIPVRLTPFDVLGMRIERNLALSSDSSARVHSWNSQTMASYASDNGDTTAGSAGISSMGNNQPYLFSASNLTPQQTSASAGRYATELGRLRLALHIEMPWDLTLSPRMLILLDEVGPWLDGIYRIDGIDRHYNSKSGSAQSIRAALT